MRAIDIVNNITFLLSRSDLPEEQLNMNTCYPKGKVKGRTLGVDINFKHQAQVGNLSGDI